MVCQRAGTPYAKNKILLVTAHSLGLTPTFDKEPKVFPAVIPSIEGHAE